MEYTGQEGLHNARLSTVVDCGTTEDGDRCVFLGFQLENYPVTPNDPELPIYRRFCNPPYGGDLNIREGCTDREEILNPILEVLGYESGNVIEFLISKAGSYIKLDVQCSKWAGGMRPMVSYGPHERLDEPTIQDESWGVDVKTFMYTEDTTLQELEALGFDKKHAKKGVEYKQVSENMSEEELIDHLF